VVSGVTGNTGSVVAQHLLDHGKKVRVIVRSEDKGKVWAEKGAEIALADLTDVQALSKALSGAEVAYLLNPPSYNTKDMFSDAKVIFESFKQAIEGSGLQRVVFLSSVGSQHQEGTGNIKTTHILESTLSDLKIPTTFLRASWFMENWQQSAKYEAPKGQIYSFLDPLDRKIPMVSSIDIGHTIAKLMLETWSGKRIINLYGPEDYSANDVAHAFSTILNRPVEAVIKPRSTWESDISQHWHMPESTARDFSEMFDGFNNGLNSFEEHYPAIRGEVTLQKALSAWC